MGYFTERQLNSLKNDEFEEEVERNMTNVDIISNSPAYSSGIMRLPELNRNKDTLNQNSYSHLLYVYQESVGASFGILKRLYKDNNWCYLAVNTIATTVSSTMPLFKIKNSNGKKIGRANEFRKLFKSPNRNENTYQLINKTVMSLAKFGNAFWFIQKKRGRGYVPNAIHHIPTELIRVMPYINASTKETEFAYIQINKYTQNAERVYLDDEMIHFKLPNDESPIYGLAPAVPIFKDFSFDLNAKNWINNWFEDTFSAGIILKVENSSKEVVKRNRSELKEKYSGARNAGKTMILEGDANIVYDGNKLKDMDFSKLKTISRDDIINTYGVALSVAGLRSDRGNSNAEVIDSEEKATLRNTVLRYQNVIKQEINHKFFHYIMEEDDIEFDFGTNSTFTSKNAIELVKASSQFAGTTINENRETLGYSSNDEQEMIEYYSTPLVATNNGVLPLQTLFDNFKNGGNQAPDTIVEQPSLKVNPDKKSIKIE